MPRPSSLFPHLVLLATLLVAGLALADHDDDDDDRGPRRGTAAVTVATQPQWAKECAACHMLYPPSLLPGRSWKAVMAGLDKHFGENASLDAPTRDTITAFLVNQSADHQGGGTAGRVARSIPSNSTPLRITQTRFFVRKHDEIAPAVFARPKVGSASNCVACHQGAEKGSFSEHDVSIPR
jgi:hypothetical protein